MEFENGDDTTRPNSPDPIAPRQTYNKNAGGNTVQAMVNKKARDYIIKKSKEYGISRSEQMRYMLNQFIEREERDERLMREILEKKVEVSG